VAHTFLTVIVLNSQVFWDVVLDPATQHHIPEDLTIDGTGNIE
jgi:hypothetical protein